MDNNEKLPTDDELSSLVFGQEAVLDEKIVKAMVERIFTEALQKAATQVVQIALTAQNERIRLDAAKYVIERKLGRITDKPKVEDPMADLLSQLVTRDDSTDPSTRPPEPPTEEK